MGNNYYSMKKHKLAKRAYTMAVETSKIGNTCLSTLLSFVRYTISMISLIIITTVNFSKKPEPIC